MPSNDISIKYSTVTELNKYVKNYLESNFVLQNIFLKGEISSYKKYPSGHAYLTLKDDQSNLNAVIWSYQNHLSFVPKIGDQVLIRGRVNFYDKDATFKVSIFDMQLDGQGAMLLKLEKLKKKLSAEGLFDESRKKQIKKFNFKIIS